MKETLKKEPADKISIPPKLDERQEIKDLNKKQFMKLISRNLIFSKCQAINLKNNQMTDAVLNSLVENGHKFPQLQTINLKNNEITGEGLKALVKNGNMLPQLQGIYL